MSENTREFAILDTGDGRFLENILGKLPADSTITVFCKEIRDFNCTSNVKVVEIPKEFAENAPKTRNFVSKRYLDSGFRGFLHVIEDKVEILKDPTEFLGAIEEMMTKLNLKTWFNTETDPCNYNFTIFNPRLSVTIDEPKAKDVYDKTVFWTSHANTSWICYDFSKVSFEDVRFDEKFTIGMFYIIEFLARRRNTKKTGELYYMNYYPTIDEERGVFRLCDTNPYDESKRKDRDEQKQESEKMAAENSMFEEMKINHAADIPVEPIIEDMFNVLVGS